MPVTARFEQGGGFFTGHYWIKFINSRELVYVKSCWLLLAGKKLQIR
jgi:hypothetical protein